MENKNAWINHVEWLVTFVTILSFFYSINSRFDAVNARFDTVNARFDQFLIAYHEESKDFHGRLERQDAEFKAHILNCKEK